MNFGGQTSESDSFAIMDRALELGINFFDTADRYGGGSRGLTEEILGRWLAQGDRRDRIVLATKLYGPMGTGANDRGVSAYHIRRAARDSMRRMQTDHIDLYQMHHVDLGRIAGHQKKDLDEKIEFWDAPHLTPGTPWDEVWQGMGALIAQDKISYVGSSNFAAWNIVQACETARQRGLVGLVSEQSVYNLNRRQVELEVVPACRAYGVGLICWSPLDGGRLAGAVEKAKTGRRSNLQLDDPTRTKLTDYEALCRDVGEEPANVALAWLLHNPVVTAPIIGPRTMEQLEGAIRATEIELGDDVLARLDELFPGPGGEAPMAYAW
jgi:aryl-alcohol dehydrogenase-like predicted oxidoreductase